MAKTWMCLQCGKKIDNKFDKCECGYMRYGENNEYAPDMSLLSQVGKSKKRQQSIFSDEEILALGLYPKDEGYKMSLISKILGK